MPNAKKHKLEDEYKNSHQEQLAVIAKNDPEFLSFLKQQDADLLQFDESDVDSCSEDEEEVPDEDEESQNKNKVKYDPNGRRIVDEPAVNSLREAFMNSDATPSWAVRVAVKSFMACVARVGANIEPPPFVINDDKVFDEVVRVCMQHLGPALFTKISHTNSTDRATLLKSRQMKVWSGVMKQYLHALILFVAEVQNADVIVSCLRAIAQVAELYTYFARLSKQLIKSMVRVWSRKPLSCRIAAMVVLCKVVRVHKQLSPSVIKSCYLGYVCNVRDVSTDNLQLISFMHGSFAQLCQLYPAITYPYAFIYIRQTAIHLRNAMIAKRKELIQTVYNWQYVQCLYLWAHVIATATQHNNQLLAELVYPLAHIVIATSTLFPSVKYLPLRMHCVKVLLLLQVNCNVYISTLSLSVQLLNDAQAVLKKKPSKGKGSIKGIDMNCIIKASSSQLEDAGFREAMLEQLFRIQLEAAYVIRSSIAFADITHTLQSSMKQFIKNCPNGSIVRLFKSMASKLNEHATWVNTTLSTRQIELNDPYCVASLESVLSSKQSPLAQFHDSWTNMWHMKKEAIEQVVNKKDKKAVEQTDKIQSTVKPEKRAVVKKKSKVSRKKKEENLVKKKETKIDDHITDLVMSDSD